MKLPLAPQENLVEIKLSSILDNFRSWAHKKNPPKESFQGSFPLLWDQKNMHFGVNLGFLERRNNGFGAKTPDLVPKEGFWWQNKAFGANACLMSWLDRFGVRYGPIFHHQEWYSQIPNRNQAIEHWNFVR